MIELLPFIYAVEVPEEATSIELYGNGIVVDEIRWNIIRSTGKGLNIKTDKKRLPPGSWQFLFTTKDVTEGQAASVVSVFSANILSTYRNYELQTGSDFYWSAKDSIQSLLRSKGITAGNYAILKKNDNQ